MQLTDSKAARLALLLQLYFEDCKAEDPGCDGPSDLSVADLLKDLELSSFEPEALDIISTVSSILRDLFEPRAGGIPGDGWKSSGISD